MIDFRSRVGIDGADEAELLPKSVYAAKAFAQKARGESKSHLPLSDEVLSEVSWTSSFSVMLGMSTGERWWSVKGEIAPARWELEEPSLATAVLYSGRLS